MRTVVRSVIVVLTLTLGVSPVLSDHCLMTCQAASRTVASSEHSCHHTVSASASSHHLANDARPCDHEHGLTASLSDDTRANVLSKVRPMAAVGIFVHATPRLVQFGSDTPPIVLSDLAQASPGRLLPLRI